jgi:hypothetical protein
MRSRNAARRLFLEPLESRRLLAPVNVLVNDPYYESPGRCVHQINPTVALASATT